MQEKQEYDYITPEHYTLWNDNNDVNDVIKASLTEEEYKGFLKGNILKYQLRLGKKPDEPIERDQKKILQYKEWYKNTYTPVETLKKLNLEDIKPK